MHNDSTRTKARLKRVGFIAIYAGLLVEVAVVYLLLRYRSLPEIPATEASFRIIREAYVDAQFIAVPFLGGILFMVGVYILWAIRNTKGSDSKW